MNLIENMRVFPPPINIYIVKLCSRILSKNLIFFRFFLLVFILLGAPGCSTLTSQISVKKSPPLISSKLDSLPEDAVRLQSLEDVQMILANRGLYLSKTGWISYIDKPYCAGISIQSHRGLSSYTENSVAGIVAANLNGFDVVEIDVFQLNDSEWVVHHDMMTGRATGTMSGERFRIERAKQNKWNRLFLRNMQTGELLSQQPPTLREAISAFNASAAAWQVLNVEIKGNPSKRALSTLDYLLYQHAGAERYYYSSMSLETLKYLRTINSSVYLGLIQEPHPASVELLVGALKKGVSNDPIYGKYQETVLTIESVGNRRYKPKRYDNRNGLSQLQDKIGSNFGLHVDIRHYVETRNFLSLAKEHGLVQIATYSINDSRYYRDQLAKLASTDALPDSVITDDDIYRLCSTLEPLKKQQRFVIETQGGKSMDALPLDADMSRYKEQIGLIDQGMYISIAGSIKPVFAQAQNASTVKIQNYNLEVGHRQANELPSLTIGEPVQIMLDTDKVSK